MPVAIKLQTSTELEINMTGFETQLQEPEY
jgi:hypothetical protein